MEKKTGNRKRRLLIPLIIILILIAACFIYVGDYYHADSSALEVINNPPAGVTVTAEKNRLIFSPEDPEAGFIFYPGGKVAYEAYAPLMAQLAEENILCVLVHMPGSLAVLNKNAAKGIPQEYPEVTRWYIGGHSLGGSMAASFLEKHADQYEGLVLLASYSVSDLSDTNLSVLSVCGSNDGVLNLEKYAKYAGNLPAGMTEIIIEGGVHAYFGAYGEQKGDGTAEITREEQIRETAGLVSGFIHNRNSRQWLLSLYSKNAALTIRRPDFMIEEGHE